MARLLCENGAMAPRRLALLAFALLLAAAGRASADDAAGLSSAERTARARTHFDLGRAHFNLGEYEAAIADFEAGYRLRPMPLFLYNIGHAAMRAKRRQKALDVFRSYLDADPHAPERAEVQRYIATLEEQLKAEPSPPDEPEKPAPPPVPAVTPPPAVMQPAPTALVTPAAAKPAPVRKRPRWLWPVVGSVSVVLVGGAVTAAVLATRPQGPPSTDFGNHPIFGP
jgi:tetratricopeptide (TPR) repeat protein